MIGWIRKLFRKKPTLREACVKEYGEDFGRLMDSLAEGIPIGNINETVLILEMIEAVRKRE